MSMTDKGYNELERIFHERDAAWLAARREALNRERQALKEKSSKGAFWMICPKCGGQMKEESLHGVMIDRCGSCAGIYLDRGEFELLARAQQGGLKRLFGAS